MIDINHIPPEKPIQVIIGAGTQTWEGWIPTHQDQLDLLNRQDWIDSFSTRKVDALLCEHVWEHMVEADGRMAASLCFEFLKPGGYLRVAVPDANFPNDEYQNIVKIGGPGPRNHPAADHKIVYDYRLFVDVFESAGFEVDLLEYCDENGRFNYHQWTADDGPIYRSLMHDHRNRDGEIKSVSIILDAKKPTTN
ncbi:MAG: hypothetical protein AAF902_08170 [Chloroflexota bacterium]